MNMQFYYATITWTAPRELGTKATCSSRSGEFVMQIKMPALKWRASLAGADTGQRTAVT